MEIEKKSAVGTKQLPYTEERWKIPGYHAVLNINHTYSRCSWSMLHLV